MAKGICEECESVFEYKVNAFICPDCRKKRLSRDAKERNLNKLGNAAPQLKSSATSMTNPDFGRSVNDDRF